MSNVEEYDIVNGNAVFPENKIVVNSNSFAGSVSLKRVVIPEYVTVIGNWAFNGCSNLKEVIIPDGVKEIGAGAFRLCKKLECVVIPDSVEKIGDSAFAKCVNLREVVIPDGVEFIGNSAFYGCKNLKSVVIPDELLSKISVVYTFYDTPVCDELLSRQELLLNAQQMKDTPLVVKTAAKKSVLYAIAAKGLGLENDNSPIDVNIRKYCVETLYNMEFDDICYDIDDNNFDNILIKEHHLEDTVVDAIADYIKLPNNIADFTLTDADEGYVDIDVEFKKSVEQIIAEVLVNTKLNYIALGDEKMFDKFANDRCSEVREAVAEYGRNKDLDILVYDKDEYVQKRVAMHGRSKDIPILSKSEWWQKLDYNDKCDLMSIKNNQSMCCYFLNDKDADVRKFADDMLSRGEQEV